jgi:HEAT repeat protein
METNWYYPTKDEIDTLIEQLRSPEGKQRQRARMLLTSAGPEAVPELVRILGDSTEQMRWQACKTLEAIGDASAAEALVQTLQDESQDVRGAAAEALVAIGRPAIRPLLEGLVHHFSSVWFREGVSYVLYQLKKRGELTNQEALVYEALHGSMPEVEAAWAAENALEASWLNRRQK